MATQKIFRNKRNNSFNIKTRRKARANICNRQCPEKNRKGKGEKF